MQQVRKGLRVVLPHFTEAFLRVHERRRMLHPLWGTRRASVGPWNNLLSCAAQINAQVIFRTRCDMKSKRKCNDCGGSLNCYTTTSSDGKKVQYFRCDVCKLRLKITLQVIEAKIKRAGEKVFSDATYTNAGQSNSAS